MANRCPSLLTTQPLNYPGFINFTISVYRPSVAIHPYNTLSLSLDAQNIENA